MNELDFLRRQLDTEARHLAAVAAACAAALAPERDPPADAGFLEACAAYLRSAVAREGDRDLAHAALLRATPGSGDAATRALLGELEAAAATNRGALAHLAVDAATPGGTVAPALGRFLAQRAPLPAVRRHALEQLVERHYGIGEWRRASLVDADAILEERELYARVADGLPEGLALAPGELASPAVRRAAGAADAARLPTR